MADAVEIIISAVDQASEIFQSIIGSAQGMADGISGAVEGASSDFDTISENVAGFSDAVANIDSSSLEELAQSLGMDTEEVERLIQTGADIGSMSAGFNEVASAADELEKEIQDDIDKMTELGSAGDVMAAQTFMDMATTMKDSMLGMADSAGTFNDSIMRAGLEAEGAGVSIDTMQSVVSDLAATTGRAGGQIRESFIKATARGVTDMDSFQKMMEGAGAQATLFGTDIQTMGDKFSSLAMKDTLMQKTLAETGITMGELATAMGMTGATADEVKAKWKELDTNQRAAILGTAASMNEGVNANDNYKSSWAGLQDQLNIAKDRLGRLAGEVLLPVLVPAMQVATDILQGLGDVISGVMGGPLGGLVSVLGGLGGAFLIGVTGAAALRNILGFLKLEAVFAAIETTALAVAEVLQGEASIASAAANIAGAAGFTGLATAAWAAATAVWAALAPLLPYIAIAAAIAIAIYEVGKAFGWWTDVGSMIDAIGAGLQRLWDAFINHPDVQAVISALSSAWDWLSSAIGNAWNTLMEFIGASTGGDFDIVHAIIEGIGFAWQIISFPIRTVITLVQQIIGFFQQIAGMDPLGKIMEGWNMLRDAVNNVVASILEFFGIQVGGDFDVINTLMQGLTNLWNALLPAIQAVIGIVSSVIGAFQGVLTGQMDIQTAILSIWTSLSANLPVIFGVVSGLVMNFAVTLGQYAINAGANFLRGIVTRISQVPGRVFNYLVQTRARILSQMNNWVNTAKSRATSMVNGILSHIRTLPGRIYSALIGAVSRIVSAGAQWVSAAKQKASEIVSGVGNALSNITSTISSALSGVKDAIVQPFQDAYEAAKGVWDSIVNMASNTPHVGGGDVEWSFYDDSDVTSLLKSNGEIVVASGGESSTVDVNNNVVLDFKNVPSHIDTDTLISAMQDKKVLKSLTNNPEFQSLDANVKNKLNLKVNRARGI